MSLPKFGKKERSEYDLSHCPFPALGVGWSMWAKRRQGGWGWWCSDGLHAQAWPRPFSAKWEIKIICSFHLLSGQFPTAFSALLLECQQNNRDLQNILQRNDLKSPKHPGSLRYQAFNEIIINLFHLAHSSKCLNTLPRYHFVHPVWKKC